MFNDVAFAVLVGDVGASGGSISDKMKESAALELMPAEIGLRQSFVLG